MLIGSEEYEKFVEECMKSPKFRHFMIYGMLHESLRDCISKYGLLDVTYVVTKIISGDDGEIRKDYEDKVKGALG